MVLVVKQKGSKQSVSFTDYELRLLTNIALTALVISFALNITSLGMGSLLLWKNNNPFGFILFFGVLICFGGCWVLNPFWNMAVRHLGGRLQTLDQIRLSFMRWLVNYYRKMSYKFFVLAQFVTGFIAVQYILAMANDKYIFVIVKMQSGSEIIGATIAGAVVMAMELLVLVGGHQINGKEPDITVKYKD